jgi:hypothetical protein
VTGDITIWEWGLSIPSLMGEKVNRRKKVNSFLMVILAAKGSIRHIAEKECDL